MKKIISLQFILIATMGAQAWADSQHPVGNYRTTTTTKTTSDQLPGTPAYETDKTVTSVTTTTISEDDLNRKGLNNEMVGITPQVGMIDLRNTNGSEMSRGVVGLTVDVNGTGFVNNALGRGWTNVYSGVTLGALYSHLGTESSTFLGSDSNGSNAVTSGAGMVMLPLNIKVGYTFDKFLLAAHAGGNAFYRSNESSAAFGINPNTGSGSDWAFLPNVGLDLQYGVTKKIAVLLRPDWTMAGSNAVVSATLGATIPL